MPKLRPSNPHESLVTTLVLVWALLFAQWIGLTHRVEHFEPAQWVAALEDSSQASDKGDLSGTASHSCKAFDGASLGVALPGPTSVLRLVTFSVEKATAIPKFFWNPTFFSHFLSRAPPLG